MNYVLLSTLLLLCLAAAVTSHQKKEKDEVKKIVKVIEFDDDGIEGKSSTGRKSRKFSSSSSSSSSWSSEEYRKRRRGSRRPRGPRGPRPQRPQEAERICENGWLEFKRPTGVWCILVGNPGITNGWFSYEQAKTACAAQGATLTGFQNENERMTVARDALNKTTALGRTVAGLWVGATNLPGCRSPSCGPFTTFQWTDGVTSGIEGMKWGVGEPDNNNWPGSTACIQQFIMAPNFVPGPEDFEWRTTFVNGDLDKYQCTAQA